ncbi:TonB-dependent receptor [Parachryseolinea silvisoli]|uniref:TonB-dependent receptor n=1 Tax=Parachryseolinea silvisoli TaxID=2873601 RepID=UPI002265D531|nr:TonB-dependent receptor [Parachryseolinea silvisoli]MCD9016461.1 TonB-dependent receptor [Parachryseolinea silvisoli]
MKKLLLFCVLVASPAWIFAQDMPSMPLTDIKDGQPLAEVLVELEKSYPVRFFFASEWLEPYTVDSQFKGMPIKSVLDELLRGSDIRYSYRFGYAVIFIRDPQRALEHEARLKTAIAKKKTIESRELGDRRKYKPGNRATITGNVKDESTRHPMAGVTVLVNDVETTATDEKGNYTINVLAGENIIHFKSVNFRERVVDARIYSSATLDIILEEAPTILDEVLISEQAVLNRRISQTSLRITDMKRAPTFLGEVDLIKQVQNQPGVTTVGEVAQGFNVRGGGVDQNLVLYDGVPVFNTSHALGFFTAFNADAVSQVSFYKGGIPAEFGGRVSSVLDIKSKEGPLDKWHGGGGIGILSSYLTAGGPVKRDTSSIMASVRSSYSDWVLKTIKSNYQDIQSASVSFYDASLKYTHKVNNKSKLTLSGYTSYDRFSLTNDTLYTSRNIAASIHYDRTFTEKLFGTLSVSFGKYTYGTSDDDPTQAYDLSYGITYPSVKLDFNYEGEHKLSFGVHHTWYDFVPGRLEATQSESIVKNIDMGHERSSESALYFSDAFYWREKFLLEAGLRASFFNRVGEGVTYHYAEGQPRLRQNITDSTVYKGGESMKTYFGLEPRVSLRYTLDAFASIKLGYNRMYQYMHLISNTAAVTPVDIWQSSNTYFKPQIADQVSLGYYRAINENMYEAYVEGFYKVTQNVLDFRDGASLILNKNLETTLLPGDAEAYGVEVSSSKIKGRLLGSLSYTYSRSWRKVDGAWEEEKINDGNRYPSNYDQPHVVQLNWRYGLSRRIFFSGTFVYHTGRPMSLPISGYIVDGVPVITFSDRNKYRIPDYHRLDLALIIEGTHKRKKILDGTWVISFYNAYGRKNAYAVFFQDNGKGFYNPYKLSVVGTIVPSVTYSFKF